jgi:hypothetical protein
MRKISSKEKDAKRQKRNGTILSIILVVILFGSVFGIIVNSFGASDTNKEEINYNGYLFNHYNEFWITESLANIFFTYNPKETEELIYENIDLTKSWSDYIDTPVYIYSEDYSSKIEIYRNMLQFAERVQDACIEGEECSEDIPTKTCSDNLIVIQVSDNNSIYENKNCVYILGEKENLIKLTDEFLFRIFDIK